MKPKKNLPLIVALSAPILMTVLVILSIYVPGLFIKPQHDFIYAIQGYKSKWQYEGRSDLITQEYRSGKDSTETPRLYYHDVVTNKSREITFDEAKIKYKISSAKTSPDGFKIVCGTKGDDFFIFGSYNDCSVRYLKGRMTSHKQNVETSEKYSNKAFVFIGWVI